MLICGTVSSGAANDIVYDVTVDTSSVSGTFGSLDFNFNPGPLVTQSASLQILNFAGNGALAGSPALKGDVGGALPGTVSFDNGTAFNDYFGGFTYGSTLSFDVSLYGPALSLPDGISTSGSTFAFSMFSNAAGSTPALTTDAANGFAFIINVNLDGTTTVNNFSNADWHQFEHHPTSTGTKQCRALLQRRSGDVWRTQVADTPIALSI